MNSSTEIVIPQPIAYHRRKTRTVWIGQIAVGGNYPIRVQSMTTNDTKDTENVLSEIEGLVDAGCEIVRVTVPTQADCDNLPNIRAGLKKRGLKVPLVADIHFTPSVAMQVVDHVEKVRINPGNFADKKLFKVFEFSDEQYQLEIDRIREKFTPLVLKCKEYGVAMRIGTNHGSLSDRIMNRYGDTPQGMVESALEFVRICEELDYHNIVLSMKASNVQVMQAAYRLLVARLDKMGSNYPLHLGVTEAGEGEDGRIKSAIGIGALLEDGIGDTVRVSLTEDSIHEVPVVYQLIRKYNTVQALQRTETHFEVEAASPIRATLEYQHRSAHEIPALHVGGKNLVRVWVKANTHDLSTWGRDLQAYLAGADQVDRPIEGVEWPGENFLQLPSSLKIPVSLVWNQPVSFKKIENISRNILVINKDNLDVWKKLAETFSSLIEWRLQAKNLAELEILYTETKALGLKNVFYSIESAEPVYAYRHLASLMKKVGDDSPLHLSVQVKECPLLDAAVVAGTIFTDGLGESVTIDTPLSLSENVSIAYAILQGCRLRISRAEYISCPSCGRTQFNLQTTTDKIREKTAHLKGVKIAVMGCIVNGPGEMADADFGYVGTGPKKVSLYVGKECVERNIPEEEAVGKLIGLIKNHDMWVEP